MTQARTCAYAPCSKEFVPTHPRHRFCEPTCRANQHYADNPEKGRVPAEAALLRVADHPLDEVRGLLEEYKGDWTLIVREHARRTLLATGYLSAADFESLGVPTEHCNLPGAQIGAYAGAGYMEAVTFKRWSAEQKASRRSGKYWIYRITSKGKERLAGLSTEDKSGEGIAAKRTIAHSRGTLDRPGVPDGSTSNGAPPALSAESGALDPLPERSDPVGVAAQAPPVPAGSARSSVAMAANSAFSPENEWA